jgi:isohexenylglutaconyl-CoA hydratase
MGLGGAMTTLPATTVIRLEREDWRLFATIDDPATRNAMTAELTADLFAILAATREDRSLRALILSGSNGAFCAGADLRRARGTGAGVADPPDTIDPIYAANRRGGELFAALDAHPLVTIAVVDGPAFGGGFGLACCADFIIAGPNARFALSETGLGLPPAQIAPYVVGRLGLRLARQLALTGRRLDGAEALALGLADRTAADEAEITAHLARLFAEIGRCAPGANAVTKHLLQTASVTDPERYRDMAAQAFRDGWRGPEGREGVRAFAEKRPPAWAGSGHGQRG